MQTAKIDLLTFTLLGVLIVYFTNSGCWQFRVLVNRSVFGLKKIYYTAEAAEKAGCEWTGAGW
jgi:hypothetical protein